MKVFLATLNPMLVLFCCILIGFVLNKKRLLPENGHTVLSKLENYVLVPALTMNTFMNYCTVDSLKSQWKSVLLCAVAVLVAIGIAYLLAGRFEKDAYNKNIYRYAITFGNFGFMGNAIVPAILGEDMLYPYMLFTLPLNMAVYTWGLTIMVPRGESKTNPLKNLLNPVVVGMLIGILLGLTGATKYLPAFATTTISNLSACMGPLAMVLTGFVIGGYNVKSLLMKKRVYVVTGLRLFVLPALFIALLWLLGADKTTLALCLFAFATPLGMNTVVFPAAYGGDTTTGASMAMISHTLCVITIPIMYTLFSLIIK